ALAEQAGIEFITDIPFDALGKDFRGKVTNELQHTAQRLRENDANNGGNHRIKGISGDDGVKGDADKVRHSRSKGSVAECAKYHEKTNQWLTSDMRQNETGGCAMICLKSLMGNKFRSHL